MDPCEKESIDVLGHITDQEREDITSSAQHALRLIAYNQIYKILGIDRIPDPLPLQDIQSVGVGGGGAKIGQKRARAGSLAGVNEDQNDGNGYEEIDGEVGGCGGAIDASATDPVGGKGIQDDEGGESSESLSVHNI